MKSIILKSALAVLAFFACAESAVAEPISLIDALQMGSIYDGRVRSAKADSMIYRAEVGKARSQLLPNIRASFFRARNHTDHVDLTNPINNRIDDYYSISNAVTLRQPLINLQVLKTYQQARIGAAKSTIDLQNEKMSLITRIAAAYFNVLFSEDNLAFSKAYLSAMKEQCDQAKSRYAREYGTVTEINEAEAALAKAIADQLEINNALDNNRQELKKLIGVYPQELCHLAPGKMRLSLAKNEDMEYWLDRARHENLAISSARKDVEASQKEVGKQRAARIPTVDLVATRSFSESDNNYTIHAQYNNASIGLQLVVPIYSGGYVSASIQQAKAKLLKSQEQLNQQELSTDIAVRKYYNGIVSSLAQLKAYTQSVKASEIALEGTRKGFLAGLRTNLDVLNAQQKLLESQRTLARYRYTYLLNYLTLKQLADALSVEDVQEVSSWFL